MKQNKNRQESRQDEQPAFDSWLLSSKAVQRLPPVSLGNHIERLVSCAIGGRVER
jgi:hypothetical protein